jgi:hypothetical protein
VAYEDKFCANSSAIGLIFLGDSATAHFSIPPTYLNASAINNTTYDQLLFLASNELDWPQQSGSTGFLKEANKDCPGMRARTHTHTHTDTHTRAHAVTGGTAAYCQHAFAR